MQPLLTTGKVFYGLGIAGIGILEFIYPGFRPVLLPIPAEATQHLAFFIYLTGAILVIAGLAIIAGQQVKVISLFLAVFLLLFVLAGHLPNRLLNRPEILGAWTDAIKLLSLSGGAFIISTLYPHRKDSGFVHVIEKTAPYGNYFFAFLLVVFGIDHFLYVDFVKTLVPGWMGSELFWTYFGAIALIGSGLAIFINFKPRLISLLLAIMLFLWVVLLHIPRAAAAQATDNGNEWTSVLECLAFCGMALIYPYSRRTYVPIK